MVVITSESNFNLTGEQGNIITNELGQPLTNNSQVKNATQWRPATGHGFVIPTGSLQLVTAAALRIVTVAGLIVVQNPTEVIPKFATIWEGSGV